VEGFGEEQVLMPSLVNDLRRSYYKITYGAEYFIA
jgi:hypothetical protein